MKRVIKGIKLLSVMALAMLYIGCDEDDAALPQIEAGFTFATTQNAGVITFLNTSENANTYKWDFGDGTESTEINPTKIYNNSGTYTVILEASNVAGASASFQDEITITIPDVLGFPITFDVENVDYSVIQTFDTTFQVVPNPDPSGANDIESNVGEIAPNGVMFQGVTFPFEEPVDFSGTDKTIELKFWSQVATDVLVKFSGGVSGARDAEVLVSHSGSGWETLTFNFATDAVKSFIDGDPENGQPIVPDGQYANLDLFVGFGQALTETVYVDAIMQIESETNGGGGMGSIEACDGGELINDFETADNSIFANFGGGVATIEDNPDTSVNMSAKVGQYVKNAGEVFGGTTIALDNNIELNAGVFSIDVYSETVRQLLFKLEGETDAGDVEIELPTSGEGWETITYDFGNEANNMNTITAITLIMDNGTQGAGGADWTILFDNIRLCSNGDSGGGMGSIEACDGGELINDFETADNSIFANFGGGVATIEDNPDTSVNMSAKVGQYVKNAGEVFGGTTIALENNIELNAGVFSIDVYSETVRQLLFKLEGETDAGDVEIELPTSGEGWETITYDFGNEANNMNTITDITLIMDNGTEGAGGADWTILFDNIRLCSNGDSGGGSATSPYCDTQVTHFGGNAGSEVLLTLEQATRADGFPALNFTIKTDPNNPAANNVPDLLVLQDFEGSPGLEAADTSVAGQITQQVFWPAGAPAGNETTFQILWSFENEPGNWQLFENVGTRISLDVTCDGSGGGGGTTNSIVGTWTIDDTPGSAGVGPAIGDVSFFDLTSQAAERACFFDDTYTFADDGSFSIDYGTETYLEGWQSGAANACGAPIAPHNNSIPATYTYTDSNDTLVLNGMGAFIGLPKVTNAGELPAVPEPSSRTYTLTFEDANTIVVSIADSVTGNGDGIWTYRMSRN